MKELHIYFCEHCVEEFYLDKKYTKSPHCPNCGRVIMDGYNGILQVDSWIPVEERLPGEAKMTTKPEGMKWWIFDGQEVRVTPIHPGNWNTKLCKYDDELYTVTHWMPYYEPAPPQQEDGK